MGLKFEVAIPTYNRPAKLTNLVKSILRNRGDITITIIPDNLGEKVFRIINKASQRSNADVFIGISDDTEFPPDTIEKVEAAMTKIFPDLDGVISMKWLNIPTVTYGAIAFCGWKFRERFPDKHIYCPDYISLFADKELGDYAESIDKLAVLSNCGLYHYHPAYYPELLDETHKKGRVTREIDEQTLIRRDAENLLWGREFDTVGVGI